MNNASYGETSAHPVTEDRHGGSSSGNRSLPDDTWEGINPRIGSAGNDRQVAQGDGRRGSIPSEVGQMEWVTNVKEVSEMVKASRKGSKSIHLLEEIFR